MYGRFPGTHGLSMGYHAWRCGMSKYRSKSLGPRCSLRECQWRCSWTSKTAIQLAFTQDSIHQYAVYMLCKKWHQNKLKGKPKYTVPNTKGYTQRRSWSQIPKGSQCTNWLNPALWRQIRRTLSVLSYYKYWVVSTPLQNIAHVRPGYLGIITPFQKKTCLKPATGFTGQYPVLSPSCWYIPHLPLVIINSLRTAKTQFQRANHQQEKKTSDLQFSRKSGIVLRSAIAETALSIMP